MPSNVSSRLTGVYSIEVTLPIIIDGITTGHRTVEIARYTGERWRAKHQAKTAHAPRYPEGTVNVRWIGSVDPGNAE